MQKRTRNTRFGLLAWLMMSLCMTLGMAGAGRAQTQNFDGVIQPTTPIMIDSDYIVINRSWTEYRSGRTETSRRIFNIRKVHYIYCYYPVGAIGPVHTEVFSVPPVKVKSRSNVIYVKGLPGHLVTVTPAILEIIKK